MTPSAHVPKFGNWDGDNIPYTTYFENARRNVSPGRKNFNPNDPEQNPDAFASGIFPAEFELRKNDSNIYGVESTKGERNHGGRHDDEFSDESAEVLPRNKSRRSKYNRDAHSGSNNGDHKRILDHSAPRRQQRGSVREDAIHDTPSSVPRFGIWDEKDPKSGNGFTVIFNKVKQEKQIAATKLPRLPADQNVNSGNGGNGRRSNSSKSKMGCCVRRPAVKE